MLTGMEVTKAFVQQAAPLAAKVVGDIGSAQQKAARDEASRYQVLADSAKTEEEASQYKAQADAARATADAWSDNGVYRVALHTATQAAIGGAAGGGAGALNNGVGVIGGNLGQQLGEKLGEEEAARQGLTGKAKDELVNSYQQAFATVGGALAGLAAGSGDGGTGALASAVQGSSTGYTVDAYNRQLHQSEKDLITKKANGAKEAEERLMRAACYEVKCWAQYPEGSVEYNTNYISPMEAYALKEETAWIKSQQAQGQFVYTQGQQILDDVKSNAIPPLLNGVKVATGGITVATGTTICTTTGIGCLLGGGWMIAFGSSNVIEGGNGLYNQYQGNGANGFNPLRYGFNELSPTWGNTAYTGLDLLITVGAMSAQVPLKVGVADGLNRPNAIFGTTVSRFNNPTLHPITKIPFQNGTTQNTMLFSAGDKGVTLINEVAAARSDK